MNEEKKTGRSGMPEDRMGKELGEEALEAVAGGRVNPFWGNCYFCGSHFNLTGDSVKVIDGKEQFVCPNCTDKVG